LYINYDEFLDKLHILFLMETKDLESSIYRHFRADIGAGPPRFSGAENDTHGTFSGPSDATF